MASNDLVVKAVRKLDLKHGDFVVFECGAGTSDAKCAELVNMVTMMGAARKIHLASIVLRGDVKLRTVLHAAPKE